jgi:uncharacterized protein YbaP (TraB family)
MNIKIAGLALKSYLFYLLCLFIIISCSSSSKNFDNSIFWKIYNPDNKTTSYLLGTIHYLDTTQIRFPADRFKELISECGNVCVESNPPDSLYQNIFDDMYVQDSSMHLSKRIDKYYYDKLLRIADTTKLLLNYYSADLNYIKPNVLYNFLKGDKEMIFSNKVTSLNYFPERDFIDFASQNKLEIIPLEEWTLEEAKNIFWGFDLSYKESLEKLKKEIEEFDVDDNKIDIPKRYSEQNLELGSQEVFEESIMILRNTEMVKKMDSLMKVKNIFVAVGAAHLPYENGMLNLLHKMGYEVTPMSIDLRRN